MVREIVCMVKHDKISSLPQETRFVATRATSLIPPRVAMVSTKKSNAFERDCAQAFACKPLLAQQRTRGGTRLVCAWQTNRSREKALDFHGGRSKIRTSDLVIISDAL